MIKRREVITLLGGAAAAWPLAARAQQPALPVIGFLHPGSPEANAKWVTGFRKGLAEAGYVEGRNVAIEYRWAHGESGRLPELAADLVSRPVAVIVTPGSIAAALVAKAATTTIPIVHASGTDPVQAGLVASLNQPGGNVTGVNAMNVGLLGKQLGLLHQLLSGAARFAVLVSPDNPQIQSTIAEAHAAGSAMGRQLEIRSISTRPFSIPTPVISEAEIPHRSSPAPHSDVLSFSTLCTTRGWQEEPLPSGVKRRELITLPALRRDPFDEVVEVALLLFAPQAEFPARDSRPPDVRVHIGITVLLNVPLDRAGLAPQEQR